MNNSKLEKGQVHFMYETKSVKELKSRIHMAHRQERRPEDEIFYSEKVCDDMYEYRHVILPKEIAAKVPKDRLMSEEEWRSIGIQQSQGWVLLNIKNVVVLIAFYPRIQIIVKVNFDRHAPEPHIILFRRPLPKAS
eukprot:MONOS_11128.1-p1 / transcript=MONOS_11128.1 / gene=MONOS_11128 / organism=Monocercomonoides_exilis_PA203 / gene_product=Cyclin-dependent kinases regulatory subunit 1 / transcript_product=Cyclin-dependent kinases regulatory subunit 1 / location=Mono_scaffold00541:37586-38773(+) / protein_length=135 / sequence_SO=supercontig / SO=protein_coding / is_pseudo=false